MVTCKLKRGVGRWKGGCELLTGARLPADGHSVRLRSASGSPAVWRPLQASGLCRAGALVCLRWSLDHLLMRGTTISCSSQLLKRVHAPSSNSDTRLHGLKQASSRLVSFPDGELEIQICPGGVLS